MKLFVDPQGNFQEAELYHEAIVAQEPETFKLIEVDEATWERVSSMTLPLYVNGEFVEYTPAVLEKTKEQKVLEIKARYKEEMQERIDRYIKRELMKNDAEYKEMMLAMAQELKGV